MKLTVAKRVDKTKGALKKIRREGGIPAIFYGHGEKEGKKLVVQNDEFQAILRGLKQGSLATGVFELHFDGASYKAIVKDVQYHPTSYAVEHIDFLALADDRIVSVNVPIQITGVADCIGVKLGGTLRQVLRALKVSCYPRHIPGEFRIDVRELNLGQSKRLSDIDIPENVRPLAHMNEVAVLVAKGKVA